MLCYSAPPMHFGPLFFTNRVFNVRSRNMYYQLLNTLPYCATLADNPASPSLLIYFICFNSCRPLPTGGITCIYGTLVFIRYIYITSIKSNYAPHFCEIFTSLLCNPLIHDFALKKFSVHCVSPGMYFYESLLCCTQGKF